MADDSTPTDTKEASPRAGSRGMTGAFTQVLGSVERDRDRDAETTRLIIDSYKATNRMLISVILVLIVVLGVLVAGVIGVGVTGRVPGVGEIEVVHP